MNDGKKVVAEVIKDLKGIVWEAEKIEYFSIDDLPPLVEKLEKIDWVIDSKKELPLVTGIVTWFLIPVYVVLLPFAFMFSMIFQRK